MASLALWNIHGFIGPGTQALRFQVGKPRPRVGADSLESHSKLPAQLHAPAHRAPPPLGSLPGLVELDLGWSPPEVTF